MKTHIEDWTLIILSELLCGRRLIFMTISTLTAWKWDIITTDGEAFTVGIMAHNGFFKHII